MDIQTGRHAIWGGVYGAEIGKKVKIMGGKWWRKVMRMRKNAFSDIINVLPRRIGITEFSSFQRLLYRGSRQVGTCTRVLYPSSPGFWPYPYLYPGLIRIGCGLLWQTVSGLNSSGQSVLTVDHRGRIFRNRRRIHSLYGRKRWIR